MTLDFFKHTFSTRSATVDDAPALANIYIEVLENASMVLDPSIHSDTVMHYTNVMASEIGKADKQFIVTNIEGYPENLVGYASFSENKHDVIMKDIYTWPHGMGTGTALVDQIKNHAKISGKEFIVADTFPEDFEFLKKMGFKYHSPTGSMVYANEKPKAPVTGIRKFFSSLIPR